MKNAILIQLFLFSFLTLQSQRVPYNTFELKCNNLYANIANNGLIFGAKAGLKDGGILISDGPESLNDVQLLYKSGLNIVGTINGSRAGFGNLFASECFPGPFETGLKDGNDYNKHWNVKAYEIYELIKDFEDNGQLNKTPYLNILKWPAQGNPYFENIEHFKLANKSLAPFFDNDGDGSYDPYKGDYPVLDPACPTNIPWEMVWCIYHDSGPHYEFLGQPITAEIHQLVYGYLGENNSTLSNSLFVRLTLTNYGEELSDVHCGIFNDFDLGCPQDDYLGCMPDENTAFAYNMDPSDSSNCHSSIGLVKTFSNNTPYISCTSLNHDVSGLMYFQSGLDEPQTTDPSTLSDILNYLKNKWKSGRALTYGGTGFNIPSTDTTQFAFPGHPFNNDEWSMASANLKAADYRSMMNYEIGTFLVGQSIQFDLAYIMTPSKNDNYFQNTDSVLANVKIINTFYNECPDSIKYNNYCSSDCVWPGDSDNNGIVNNHDILNIGVGIGKSGAQRNTIYDGWAPFTCDSWGITNGENVNFKHFDSDGSGKIDSVDVRGINYNFNKTNESYTNWGGYNLSGNNLSLYSNKTAYKSYDIFDLDVIFMDENSGSEIFGLSSTLQFDTSLIRFVGYTLIDTSVFGLKNNLQHIVMPDGDKIHFGITRTDGVDTSLVNGPVLKIKFTVRNTSEKDIVTNFNYSNYQTSNSFGKISATTASPFQIIINKTLSNNFTSYKLPVIYPNPADDQISCKQGLSHFTIEIHNSTGTCIIKANGSENIYTGNLENGFYTVRIRDEFGNIFNHKLIIQH